MPELPDVTVYVERMQGLLRGRALLADRRRSRQMKTSGSRTFEEMED